LLGLTGIRRTLSGIFLIWSVQDVNTECNVLMVKALHAQPKILSGAYEGYRFPALVRVHIHINDHVTCVATAKDL